LLVAVNKDYNYSCQQIMGARTFAILGTMDAFLAKFYLVSAISGNSTFAA
jgi:hypothetical protein